MSAKPKWWQPGNLSDNATDILKFVLVVGGVVIVFGILGFGIGYANTTDTLHDDAVHTLCLKHNSAAACGIPIGTRNDDNTLDWSNRCEKMAGDAFPIDSPAHSKLFNQFYEQCMTSLEKAHQ